MRYPGWVVRVRDLDGPREAMCFDRKVVLIDRGVGSAERRCSLAHAVAHLDLEHDACAPNSRHERREESHADQLAARRLITLDALTDAIVWSHNPIEACDELGVDLDTLRCRGAHIHPSERLTIQAALAARDDVEESP